MDICFYRVALLLIKIGEGMIGKGENKNPLSNSYQKAELKLKIFGMNLLVLLSNIFIDLLEALTLSCPNYPGNFPYRALLAFT